MVTACGERFRGAVNDLILCVLCVEGVYICLLERSLNVVSALGTCLDEEQPFLLCPSFPFLGRHLSSLEEEVALVAYKDEC